MKPEGLYEQIISNQLNEELESLDSDLFEIQFEKLSAEDSKRALTIYISNVIEKALLYLRDNYNSEQSHESLVAQITLCNDIISQIISHTQESDFEDFNIHEKAEILTYLHKKLEPSAKDIKTKTIRPRTSLLENTLFTGSKKEPDMLSELKREIQTSDSIDFLVSFIKWSGIRRLIENLKEFADRTDTKLRILTTTYMKATNLKAIKELASLKNTEVKINYETNHMRMHAKSYYFRRNTGFSTAYIGSSNLSNSALTEGLEWNIKVTEQESFDILKKFAVTFESYWNDPTFELFDVNNLDHYNRLKQELQPEQNMFFNKFKLQSVINPYPYQQEILDQLEAERKVHHHYKNLVVASTGTGKTVVAAFDYRRFKEENPDSTFLFIAHRKEILEQSVQKFREVLNDFNFGELYVGNYRPESYKHLFMSIQSFNSSEFFRSTDPGFYDYIIVDEFHHAAAKSYQDLLNYYTPKILLGLTATPERHDGKDILQYFDGRIASEMRLVEAIDRKLLSPFHYFGISDSVDYSSLTWKGKYDSSELENIYTADDKRASLILESTNKYVTDLNQVKGLGFCVSVAHAEFMADFFTRHHVPSIALSAKTETEIRDTAKKELEKGHIRFIFVVDLYNEGIDIPEVNTILFLRPTESATVFLQQLGRGLRLHPDKECLTVLDFVGQAHKKYNYEMKYRAMIGPSKYSIRKYIDDGFFDLPRGSYIQLERMAQKYVLQNLTQSSINRNTLADKMSYFEAETNLPLTLKNFLEFYNLSLYDFYMQNGSRTFTSLLSLAGLHEIKEEISQPLARSLSGLFHINSEKLINYWLSYIDNIESPKTEDERLMLNMLYYTFYDKHPEAKGFVDIEDGINQAIINDDFRSEIIQILIYNLEKISFLPKKANYPYICPLEVHCQYNKNQILAAYGYYNETQSPAFREGVLYRRDLKTDLFLINLNKSEKDFSPTTMYEDYAINETLFHWQSQSQISQKSTSSERYINHKRTNNHISLFVRESKTFQGFTNPYTFLGNATYISHNGNKPVSFTWELEVPIPPRLIEAANKSKII